MKNLKARVSALENPGAVSCYVLELLDQSKKQAGRYYPAKARKLGIPKHFASL